MAAVRGVEGVWYRTRSGVVVRAEWRCVCVLQERRGERVRIMGEFRGKAVWAWEKEADK